MISCKNIKLKSPLNKESAIFFFFMYLLGLTNIVFEPWNGSRFWMCFELFADLYLLCAFLLVFPAKVRHGLRIALAIVFYFLSLVDMACYVRLQTPITPMLVQLLLQSNWRESTEALNSYLNLEMLHSPVSVVLVQMVFGVFALWNENKIVDKIKCLVNINQKTKLVVKSMACLFFIFCLVTSWENKEYLFYRIICQYSELETQKKKDFSQKTNFYIPIYRLAYSLAETHRLQKEIGQFEISMNKAKVDSVDYSSPHIVLIIGESYNRHHSSLYGYDKPTTPLQSQRWRKGELVVFKDMISSWNTTCESLKNIFSTQCVGQNGNWASAPLFPLLFRQAGYHTSFLSNQYVIDNLGFSDFIEDAFFNNPATSKKMFDTRNTSTHEYDLSLLDDYRHSLRQHPYTLDIFHFLGLHADFSLRYPQSYRKFSIGSYSRKDLSKDDCQILADYDNAVVYNDYVIDSILKLYENQDAVVIFVPDHGERVFDNSTEWGRNLTWRKNDIKQQFEIPFWIWSSSIYKSKHPLLWKQIQVASNKRGMTDTLAQLLLHLAGIHTPWYYPNMDMLNEKYDSARKRIIRDERDFDEIMGN